MLCSSSSSSRLPVIINTRPVERAVPLTRHLQAAGFVVADIPMLTLQPRVVMDADVQLMQQWLAGDHQALVVVSPTAAASGLALWQELEQEAKTLSGLKEPNISKPPSHIIAVGDATAAVLQKDARLQASNYQVLQPLVANNEGMLAMPEIDNLQAGDKLLVWRGLGGRRLLVDTLQARGVHIDSIAWYERTMPSAANSDYKQWLQQYNTSSIASTARPKPIVIVSSGTAFEHWTSIVSQEQSLFSGTDTFMASKLADFTYIVLGVRLADMLAKQQLSYTQVEDLAPETILKAIQHGLQLR